MKARSRAIEGATRPLRVLHVISSFDGGGAERVLLTLLSGLPQARQHLALPGPGALQPLVPASVPIHWASTQVALAGLMNRLRPHLVHAWLRDSLLTAVPAAAHLGIPVVYRLYNVPSEQNDYDPGGADHRELMSRALGATAAVVALSSAAAEMPRCSIGSIVLG